MSSKSLTENQVEKFISQCQDCRLAKSPYHSQGLCMFFLAALSCSSVSCAVNYYPVLGSIELSARSRPYTLRLKT